MQIKIMNANSGNWYREYIGTVFDVERNDSREGFRLIYTSRNENILSEEQNGQRRGELLKRLKNTKAGMRLGVSGENASIMIEGTNNKDYKALLGKE